jgi:drug/metabolite transporter (DMT)-like permease
VSRRAWALFVAMSLIWGVPYLLIKIAVAELSPLEVVFARVLIAAVLLLPVALSRGALAGLRPRLGWLVGLALLEVAVPFPLIAAAEQRIASSLTGILISVEPLFIALLALRFDAGERVSGLRLVGLLIGLAGVVTLLGLDLGGSASELMGAGMVLLATLCYAGGAMLVQRRLRDVDPLGVSASTLVISVVLLAPWAWWSLPAAPPAPEVLAALVVLGAVCTAIAFILFFALIAAAGPGRAAVITYVNPAVAVALGIVVLGEPITAATVAGFLLIIAGCWLATGSAPPGLRGAVDRLRVPIRGRTAGPPGPEPGPDWERAPVRDAAAPAPGHGAGAGTALGRTWSRMPSRPGRRPLVTGSASSRPLEAPPAASGDGGGAGRARAAGAPPASSTPTGA